MSRKRKAQALTADAADSSEDCKKAAKKEKNSHPSANASEKATERAEHFGDGGGGAYYNEVLSFGSGDMSQLGLGSSMLERKNPTPIKTLEGYNVIGIASGALHNAALLDSGKVWTWGCNDDEGQHIAGRREAAL
jgi:alpha-tubulin suppressor-like RCC1 family protein